MKKALPVISAILAVALIVLGVVCIKQNKAIKTSEFQKFNNTMFYCSLIPGIESDAQWDNASAVLRQLASTSCNVPDDGDNVKLLRMCNLLSNVHGSDPERQEIQRMLDKLVISWDTQKRIATVVDGDIDGLLEKLAEVLDIPA